jgi:hypothetical protein
MGNVLTSKQERKANNKVMQRSGDATLAFACEAFVAAR